MTLRQSWEIARITRERDALGSLCAALIAIMARYGGKGDAVHASDDDLREAVRKLIRAAEVDGRNTPEECARALEIVDAFDGWMGRCGDWGMLDVVDRLLEEPSER